ncbi:MAG: hypothetical protein HC860_21605 [Alkalinema sp. RU_4_3]|nr:hypothetical protein [Alkalinema sp. RU_4_3]
MLSADLKEQVVNLSVGDRLELVQIIVASLQDRLESVEDLGVVQPLFSLSAIRRKVKQLGDDPEAPTLEEVSQIVRKVRR